MIRYRMKDVTYLNIKPYECGRTSPRTGRADDMPIIEGINVFPRRWSSR